MWYKIDDPRAQGWSEALVMMPDRFCVVAVNDNGTIRNKLTKEEIKIYRIWM
jgi:hypothetical protein